MFNLPRLGKRIEEILGGFGNQAQRALGNASNQVQRGVQQVQRQATNAARQNVNVINRQVQQVQRQVPKVDFTQLSRNIANAANPVNQVKYQADYLNRNIGRPLVNSLAAVGNTQLAKTVNDPRNRGILAASAVNPLVATATAGTLAQRKFAPGTIKATDWVGKNIAEPSNQTFLGGRNRQIIDLAGNATKLVGGVPGYAIDKATGGQFYGNIDKAVDYAKDNFAPEPGKKNSLSPTRVEDYNDVQKKSRFAGSVQGQIADMALIGKVGNTINAGVKALPAVQKLSQGGKIAQGFSKVAPQLAESIGSEALYGAAQKDYSAGEAGQGIALDAGFNILTRGGSRLVKGKGKMLSDVANQVDNKLDDLDPLLKEARKYKSADEFVKNTDHTPQTTRVYIKSKFRDGGGYADVPVIREEKNITLYQGGTGENRQFWTPNKEYAKKFGNGEVVKKTGNFYQIDNGNRMTDVYVDADKQLTDLYNQATKGADVKPKVELKQPDVPTNRMSEQEAKDLAFQRYQETGSRKEYDRVYKQALNSPKLPNDGGKSGVARVKEIVGETPQVRNARMVRNEAVTLSKTIDPLIAQETKLAKVARKYQSELNKLVKLKPSPRVNNKIALRNTKLQSVLGELEQITPQVKTLKNQRRALAREATGLKGNTPDMTPEQRAKNVELENRRREILGLEPLAEADVGGNVGGFVAKSQGLQDRVAGGMRTLETKEGVAPRAVAKGVRTLVGTSGKSSDQMFQTKKLRSSISNLTEDLNNEYKMLTDGYSKESLQRVAWKLDPEVAKQKNVKLNEQEQVLANKLRELADIEHTQAYLSGTITKEQYEKGLGKYLTRAYESKEFGTAEELDALAQWSGYKIDSSLSKRRKNVNESMVDDQLDDPVFKLMKQRQFTETNRIVSDYQQWLSRSGMVIDDAKPGYSRLPESAGWGDIAGKYVPNSVFEDITGFHFGNQAAQSLYNLAGQWERLGPRRWRKMALTIMNPAVRFINKEFNSALAFGGGVNNLVEYRVGLSRAIKDIKVGTKGDIGTMKRLGLFSGNITREEMMQTVKQLKANGKTNAAIELIKKLGDSYGRVDDAGKVAYVRYMMKNKGLSMEAAVKQAQRYFQDYSSVGLLWDISAKTPIAGKPFGRFLGDFMFRILPNAIQDRPMRAIGLLGAMYGLQHIASTASGETPEDRETRENRIGAGKVPIIGMSTEFQTPWGAVDIRRLIGVSGAVSSGEGDPGVAEIMPFQSNPIMTNQYTGERELNPNFVGSDPLIGPAIQAAMDRDFRGKPIADPDAAGTDKFSGMAESAQPEGEGLKNKLNFLRTAYAPSYVNEMENLKNTLEGKPTIYGSKRTPGQQLTRMTVGVRTEQFGPKEAQDRRDTQQWLAEKKELDDIIKGMPKAKQEAFKRVSGYYKLREKVPNEFEPGSERWKKAPVFNFSEDKWKEFTSNPELYDVMVAQKEKEHLRSIEENKKDPNIKVKPIQPEFDRRLSGGFRKQLINNKSLAPGEDVEADERLYSHSEWDTYQQIKEEYKKAAAAYYPKSDEEFVDEMVKHKQADFPKKGKVKQAYDDAYALYAAGQGPKPAYNDAVDADKEAYNEAKREWTNKERKARGLDPISKEMWDNVTFGYESDEEKVYKQLKYGKGYGGYGYGGSGSSGGGSAKGFNPYKYNVSTKKAQINKPSVKMLTNGAKITAVKSATPKVSIKKSKV